MVPGAHATMTVRDWALLILLSGVWGASFYFYKILDGALPAMTISFGRVGIGASALYVILRLRGLKLSRDLPWARLAVVGVLSSSLPFILYASAEKQISSSLAALLNGMTPIFGVLVAPFFAGGEKWTRWRVFGAASGLLGVAILVGFDALHGLGRAGVAGQLECLCATLCYAFGANFARGLRGLPSLVVATGQMIAGAAVVLPFALVRDQPWTLPVPGLSVWAALLGIALLGSTLAYIIYFALLARVGPTNVMLTTFLSPVSALLLGWLALGEHLSARVWVSVAFIALGMLCVEGFLPRLVSRVRARRTVTTAAG